MFKEVKFTVAGKETSNDNLMVFIPSKYKPMFEGHNFKDMHDLSMALMHASCAAEARDYNRPWKVQEYEEDLRNVLSK